MKIEKFTLLIIILSIVIIVFFAVSFIMIEVSNGPTSCVDVSATSGFVYDVCYDSYSQNVFMSVKDDSGYYLDTFRVSFFDGRDRSYDLGYNVENVSQLYKFHATRNPLTIVLDLNVLDVVNPLCNSTKKLSVRYCDARKSGDGRGSLNGSDVGDYVPLPYREEHSNNTNYTEIEKAWINVCMSDWECSEWEECDGEFQRRSCLDLEGCSIPIDSPDTVRYCGDECIEDWNCEWGDCVRGFMEPACRDLNNCGTEFDKPGVMNCDTEMTCRPDIFCGDWGECEVDYGLFNLAGDDINGLMGVRLRICSDRSGCVEARTETASCSMGVDIYVKKFSKCGEDFVGIYNKLNDNLIARIKEGEEVNPYMGIYFDDVGNNIYCDYCYDGILNSDEEGIDCGGSCISCGEKYRIRDFRIDSWFDDVVDWFKGLF